MARVETRPLAAHGVDAPVSGRISQRTGSQPVQIRHKHLGHHGFHVPLEWLTLQLVTQGAALRKIAQRRLVVQRGRCVLDKAGVLVHPHRGRPQLVPRDLQPRHFVGDARRVFALPELRFAEDVEDMGARDVLDASATLPSAEADLHLLTAVEAHARVIPAEVHEELPVRSEEAARHDGRRRGLGRRWVLHALGRLAEGPSELQDAETGRALVIQRVEVQAVDAWYDHTCRIPSDAGQQRLRPARRRLDVAVQEDENLASSAPSPFHPRQHEAPTPSESHKPDFRQLSDVLLQWRLQPIPTLLGKTVWVRPAHVVHQDDLRQQFRRRVAENGMDAAK
mmetsp:Transcript_293/g.1034  ORF Transcript_293/g.1034 Transcript_293/m.1034 type:complete len:337 (+) Transcript_293:401-1411(+)